MSAWRRELPVLTGRAVLLREPTQDDVPALVDLMCIEDAARFGLEETIDEVKVARFVERAARDREAGAAVTFIINVNASQRGVCGLVQVRAHDPSFESAEWEMTLTPSVRGSGVFIEAARLVGSFVFNSIGTHRLESRVQVQNGRANGALRKIGAVQEGILRRSVRRRGEYVDQVLWSVLKDDWSDQWVPSAPRVH